MKHQIKSSIKNPIRNNIKRTTEVTYADEVLADNPIIYIKGNTNDVGIDSSGNSYNMVENGTINSVARSGFPESSVIDLSTKQDLPMNYQGNELNETGDITFEMWAEFTEATTGWIDLFHYGIAALETEESNYFYLYYYKPAGSRRIVYVHEYGAGLNETTTEISYEIPVGVPNHIVCTRDATTKTVKIYIDSVEIGSTTYVNAPTGGTSSSCITPIGNIGSGGGQMPGYVSSFAVYHSKLSTDRIEAHYAKGSS